MIDLPWLSMGVVSVAFLAVFVLGEIAHRGLGIAPELSRKLDHAAAGPVALVLPAIFATAGPVILLAALFAIFLVGTHRLGVLRSVHGIARPSAGAYLYPLAIAATFVLAAGRPDRYAIAILALAFADAASGLVGARFGRTWYEAWGQRKSVEGSLAACAVAAVMTAAVLIAGGDAVVWALLVGAFTGLVVAIVEAALPWGLDNLGVPLAALAAVGLAGSPVSAAAVLLGALGLLALATSRSSPPWVRATRARGTATSDIG